MSAIRYEAIPQGKYWAVRRHGKRGGIRLVAVYDSAAVATAVAARLDLFRSDEP